ncbi:MAG: hypothetical protein WC227_01000 [Patescibacteria group bacterium]|jgi:hypothetical protein
MLEENKKILDKLMGQYSDNVSELKDRKEADKQEQETFAKTFNDLKHNVIWPVVIDIGNQLNQYGQDYSISEDTDFLDATAKYHPSNITIFIYPKVAEKAMYTPETTPYVAFVADKYARKVGILVSTMMPDGSGVTGSYGTFELNVITKEFVEKEVVNVLKDTLIFHQE